MICTTCQAPAEQHLCPACVRDLSAWLTKGRELLPELDVTVLRQDVVRKAGSEGANGTRTQGSAAPLNIDAWQVREDLRVDLGMSADQYAQDVWAVGEVGRVVANIQRAELLVSGPEDNAPTPTEAAAMRERISAELPEDLGAAEAVDWLKSIHDITIKPATIRQWASRKHITRTNQEGWPTYNPAELLLQAKRDMLASVKQSK